MHLRSYFSRGIWSRDAKYWRPSGVEFRYRMTRYQFRITSYLQFQTRIKRVMQSDDEIGRMVASVPVAIGRAMEHFAEKLLETAAQCVLYSTSRTLSPSHM